MDEHYEQKILRFIFTKVSKYVNDRRPESKSATSTVLNKLCNAGLICDQQWKSVVSCATLGDQNK